MKRVLALVLMALAAAMLLAPMEVGAANQADGGGAGSPNGSGVTSTACTSSPGNPCRCPSGYVAIGLPVIGNNKCISNDPATGGAIINYLRLFLRVLGGAVGGVIVLIIIIAGIQYMTSAGDPGQLKAAKNRIVNAITALMLFIFMYAILGFLIPGGIL